MEYGAVHHDRALRSAEGFLLPNEEVVIASNQHWIVIAEPVFTCLLSFALVVWVNVTTNAAGGDLFWWLWFAILLRTVWMLIEWRRSWFIATDQRFLKITGMFVRKVAMMPLKKVTDITYNRTVPGQILRYGTFRFETAGQDQGFSQLRQMPHPNHLYQVIVEYVLGRPPTPAAPPTTGRAAPTKPMQIDFGDRTRSRDENLYEGGGRSAGKHGEPDTEPFEIPEDWRRTDHEGAPTQPKPRRHGHVMTNPVQQPVGRFSRSWWRRAKTDTTPSPQHHSIDGSHSVLRGTPHEVIDRYDNAGSSPITEAEGTQRRTRRGR